MCMGQSTRVSQGGSIAVLRPRHTLQRTNSDDMRLLFSNSIGALLGRAGTQVDFEGWEDRREVPGVGGKCWVVIHRDGDLSASSSPMAEVEQDPFFTFELDAVREKTMALPRTLDLGVGEAGIIGRRVSLMSGSRERPIVLAEGIMGWN